MNSIHYPSIQYQLVITQDGIYHQEPIRGTHSAIVDCLAQVMEFVPQKYKREEVDMAILRIDSSGTYQPIQVLNLDQATELHEQINASTMMFLEIALERIRQNLKFGVQTHSAITWSAILSEESGEVAKAALQAQYDGRPISDMRREVIQTAAVASQIVERMDQKYMDFFER